MNALRAVTRVAILALAASAAVVADAQAQRLGRLLTSPEERAALDAMRRQAALPQPAPAPEPEPVPEPEVQAEAPDGPSISRLTINGVVRRSGGPSSVWVNGDLLERGGVSREGVAVEAARGPAGSVRLRLPSGAGTVALRPGQQIDVDTGALLEAYESRSADATGSAFVPGDGAARSAPAAPESPSVPADSSSESVPDAVNRALESMADPDSARSAKERAAIESLRDRVEQALVGRPAAPKP